MTLFSILFSVVTTLTNGMFTTTYATEVQADMDACNKVVNTMISNLQQDPQLLSEWAFAGLGKQADSEKNALYLVWKHSEYYPERKYSKLILDVLVDDRPTFTDVVIESQVTDTMMGNARNIRVDIYYSGSLLSEAYGTFHLQPKSQNVTLMGIETNVKFGWFFRAFISRRLFSKNIDWRLERFVTNLKMAAEGNKPSDAYWEQVDKQ